MAKKYEPTIHPVMSWIPLVNVYVFARISHKSPWWILALLVPFLNIFAAFYLSYWVAKRTGRDVGTMLLIIFFKGITILWLGLEVNGKKKTLVWIL